MSDAEEGVFPETLEELGQWLKDLREDRDLNRSELARAVGVDRTYVRNWEDGKHEPRALLFLRILSALGVKPVPAPPDEIPRALNEEMRLMRQDIAALRDVPSWP